MACYYFGHLVYIVGNNSDQPTLWLYNLQLWTHQVEMGPKTRSHKVELLIPSYRSTM